MNWINIKDKLPEFDETVLLYEEINNKPFMAFGFLLSINKKGNHFINFKAKDVSSIYGQAFESVELKPTKWCKIEIPQK